MRRKRIAAQYLESPERDMMNLLNQELRSVDPDLRDVLLDQLADLGDSVLAHSLALYRQRLEENGLLLSAFDSNI
jgi:FXSXX-COOH protein